MSVFSETLQDIVQQSNMKIASLAKLSGVDRSFIQKMLTGERIPGDPEVLDKLSGVLMLSPSEKRRLRETYAISKMGEATYYRRILVKRLIEGSAGFLSPPPVLRERLPDPQFERPALLVLNGKAAVSDALRLLTEETLSKDAPRLRAILQPDSAMAAVLLHYARSCPALTIEHILCFDSELQYQKENKYNLQCLRSALAFFFGSAQYTPYFYYDSIPSKTGPASLFPWMVLGENWVLTISPDEERAMLLSQKEAADSYAAIFEEIRSECLPVISCGKEEIAWQTDHWMPLSRSMTYSLQYEPRLSFFFSMDMAIHAIKKDLPQKEEILFFLQDHQKEISLLDGGHRNTSFFTKEGLDRVFDTGRISGVPAEYYEPLSPAVKAELLRRMLLCIQNGTYTPYFINTAKFRIPEGLSFLTGEPQQVSCRFRHPLRGISGLQLHEKSIVYSLCDFFEYLKETGLVCSTEQTADYLRQKLEELISN